MTDVEQELAGIYVDLDRLIALEGRGRNVSFLPRQPVHSLLSGRFASRMRGRGLNFEEIRDYRPGDDVRSIDWKVTARLQKPHVRVFNEERDRQALLVVDQRLSMFFGSRLAMKSVTAAEAAAIGAWRILGVGDRVGAILFNDRDVVEVRARRSRATVLQILSAIVAQNQALGVGRGLVSSPAMLNTAIEHAQPQWVALLGHVQKRDSRSSACVQSMRNCISRYASVRQQARHREHSHHAPLVDTGVAGQRICVGQLAGTFARRCLVSLLAMADALVAILRRQAEPGPYHPGLLSR